MGWITESAERTHVSENVRKRYIVYVYIQYIIQYICTKPSYVLFYCRCLVGQYQSPDIGSRLLNNEDIESRDIEHTTAIELQCNGKTCQLFSCSKHFNMILNNKVWHPFITCTQYPQITRFKSENGVEVRQPWPAFARDMNYVGCPISLELLLWIFVLDVF